MEYCKGCLGITFNCYFIKYAEEFKCPCAICLIKIVCEAGCDDFEDFSTNHDMPLVLQKEKEVTND